MGERKETRVQGKRQAEEGKHPGEGQKFKMSQEKRNRRPVTWLETTPSKVQTGNGYWGGDSCGTLRNVTGGWDFPSKFSLPLNSSSEEKIAFGVKQTWTNP